MENPNYYAILPANVRYDKDLKPMEKILYSEITALAQSTGVCFAQNSYFANLYDTHKNTVGKWINQLTKKGFVSTKIIYKQGTKEVEKRLISIVHNRFDPINQNVEGYQSKSCDPINQNVEDNNTSNNNIYNNQKSTTKKKFTFNLTQKTQYENVSQEYKDNLKKEIEQLKGNLPYEDFILSLEAKGYQYKNFLSAYKQWNKNAKPTQQKSQRQPSSNKSAFALKEERQQRQVISDNIKSKLIKQGIGSEMFAKWYNDPQTAPKGIKVLKEKGRFIFIPTINENQQQNLSDTNIIDAEVL